MRLVVIAEDEATFCTLKKEGQNHVFVQDAGMPTFPTATLARFAPKRGNTVAIMDLEGLHFVDVHTGVQSMMLANAGYVAIAWSPNDRFLVGCEKWYPKNPQPNLHVIHAESGEIVAKWEWKNTPKEGPKSVRFMDDESFCFRLLPQQGATLEPNSIEIYKNCDFTEKPVSIAARFPVKTSKKSDPAKFINGKFDGLDLCPRNPANPESGPFYLLAWQHAAVMVEEDENGTVYFYDLNQEKVDRSKFMI